MIMKQNIRKTTSGNMATWLPCCLVTLLLCYFATSCTSESYETGDGRYSYLRTDYVEVHTSKPKQIDYAISDRDERIAFKEAFAVKWAEKADTIYRALLYYNRTPEGNKPILVQPIYVLQPKEAESVEKPKTDPVGFESAWLSENGRYLNLVFNVKTGKADDEKARQTIGIMSENLPDGTLRLTLLHGQENVPQYYSTRIYASIPMQGISQRLLLSVNTYDGLIERAFNTE
jgi:hypothetical protein